MKFLKELLRIDEADKKKKKNKKETKDKKADKYDSYIAGNMLFRNTCSGELSGDKKISTDTRI